ncbi:PREDICTED: uncharacterized protein LOC107192299 [Dufourea novaeangliae]|uniref:uncharacterized protein LOC107192299 n=1 Tax=Dufourea novaeangliae TaxID=178035 RepID=UPI00076703D2|nr:PREDICTED: uncharacterized protein LOC107192299 [Dufourea novaeangliae]
MKEHDGSQPDDPPAKYKGRPKKRETIPGLFAASCWPRVMISRDNKIGRKMERPADIATFTFYEGSSGGERAQDEDDGGEEGDRVVEHLYCEENGEQGVCLITSSSGIGDDLGTGKASEDDGEGPKKVDELVRKKNFVGSTMKHVNSKSDDREIPIFVDLTTDEKNTWKQTILKRSFDDVKTPTEISEPRIMIADSSSKSSSTGSGSLATALSDRGPCLIPMQPNRSLPIRPAPLPTRSFRKDGRSLVILSRPVRLDVVEVEPVKSTAATSNTEIPNEKDETPAITVDASLTETPVSGDYILPLISNAGSRGGMKRKVNDDADQSQDTVKESSKKRKSQEADSSQGRENSVKNSVNEFLRTFCVSNDNGGTRDVYGDKCAKVVSTTREDSCVKVVPPLRLKKVARTKTVKDKSSKIVAESGQESNYKIIRGKTSRSRMTPSPSTWNGLLHEKDTNLESLKNDSCKLKYRRNRLKQKLRELRGKALDLAKHMANDSSSQQNTRLRQVMNRYEKQIENLSKLHSKLSAALSGSGEVTDVNDNATCPPDEGYLFVELNVNDKGSMKVKSPASSPEPPKLSPRFPVTYTDILPEEVRNSPPVLPRVCLTISSSQDDEFQVSESKIWTEGEESKKQTISSHSIHNSSIGEASADLEECIRTAGNSLTNSIADDFDVDKRSLDHSDNVVSLFDNNQFDGEEMKDQNCMEELSPGRLVIQEDERIDSIGFPNSGPVISSVTSGLDAAATVSASEIFESTGGNEVLQPNSYGSSQKEPFAEADEACQSVQKVTSSSGLVIQVGPVEPPLRQEAVIQQQNCKAEKSNIDAVQGNTNNYSITEQFPTLGNWVARMSSKQSVKTRSKLQQDGTASFGSTENSARQLAGSEAQKIIGPNATNDIMNTTSQYGNERWQYYHHQHQQQRQQQLLQHVASVTLGQSVPTVSPFRPSICPPIPINQYYSNNYAIDPYNGTALGYHPGICPYGPYPYHSRLHPATLSSYHFPMQESLRPHQHLDRRFPPLQETMMKYPPPATSNQTHSTHSTALAHDHHRGSSLPSLFLSPTSLSSPQQTLPRAPVPGYPASNQFPQNRMIPDVVAAAAAAAVVAAASLDRQHETLACNRSETDMSTAAIGNVITTETPRVASSNKQETPRLPSQSQNTSFTEEAHENVAKYQQMQNFLFDRLELVKTTDSFIQQNPTCDGQPPISSIVPTTPYRILVPQMTRAMPVNEARNCETPHLGKVDRSPRSLHNLACSNCGVIGPKFKCLGCETVFYCNERCQEKHWNIHVQWCPKRMPKLKKVT